VSAVTFGRVIHKDLTLRDGVEIPAGTVIGVASHAITHDPAHYPNPSEFNGFRFVPPDDLPEGVAAPPSFVTTNASNLSWGYGKHACSGRFFATFEIKTIMSYLLLNYDFKFRPEQVGRPKNISFELQNAPDPNVEILLKRRNCSVAEI
jgi:cytochrome P450